ncbi:MAG TPA: hypothetical protein V6D13_05535 [Halomicronema sp.]
MPENAGKKRFIQDFLKSVQNGSGLLESIWIERAVRTPGSDGEGSTARSLSGRPISNITELLEDDLKNTFDDGYFTFRFVAALVGSGKTSLLTYLHELAKTQRTYRNYAVVVQFQLSDLQILGGNQAFSIKLYCHLLAHTFHQLLHNRALSRKAKEAAEQILKELLIHEPQVVSELKAATNFKIQFSPRFNKYVSESGVVFEEFFFYVIEKIAKVEPRFTFVYLNDELDGLQPFPDAIKETRFLFKQLIKRSYQDFNSKIRLLIYIVGTSDNVLGFIGDDSVLQTLVTGSIINLNKGYSDEFQKIREKIDNRIKEAYKGYKNFDKAWEEIHKIPVTTENYVGNLRQFCRDYGAQMLTIHAKYFEEAPEQKFEGDARQLLEAQCRQHWEKYLNKYSYTLSECSTTTVLAGHAFDCYIELLHNGHAVARAFGEAKNYELLKGHLDTFEQWLRDVDFQPFKKDLAGDLAFMIAPSCPSLLKRKLELKNIQFIEADKQLKSPTDPMRDAMMIDALLKKIDHPESAPYPINEPLKKIAQPQPLDGVINIKAEPEKTQPIENNVSPTKPVNINTASKEELVQAFKGTGMKQNTIDLITNFRPFKNLDHLMAVTKSTDNVKQKLQTRLDNREICF